MSLVSEIKCARCDRKYSGLRSRCPYCGARRIGRGKYTEDNDNAKGKMLISIILLGALVIAAGIMLFSAPMGTDAAPPDLIEEPEQNLGLGIDVESGVTTGEGLNIPDRVENGEDDPYDPEGLGTPATLPGPEVTSVTILHNNSIIRDFTEPVGTQLTFTARVEPVGVTDAITWETSNEDVFEVVALNLEGTQARLTLRGPGTATLTVSVGGQEATTIVRVRR